MSYNIQYGHTDRSSIARRAAELEERIDNIPEPTPTPTPDPEPTGETTDYEGICQTDLGGTWDATAMTCSFTWLDPNTGAEIEKTYSTENLEAYTACSNGSYWDFENDMCCDPECDCLKSGGTYSQETGECEFPEPIPDPSDCTQADNPQECECIQMGGIWEWDEDLQDNTCHYPEGE